MTEDNLSPQARAIRINDPQRDNVPRIDFMLARAASIDAYAGVEQSLAALFATLLKTDQAIAGIVFFKIVSTRARMGILEAIIKNRYTSTYNTFWKSAARFLQGLDGSRNRIVHWHVVQNLETTDVGATSTFTLNRPDFWTGPSTDVLVVSDLKNFFQKCDFVSRLLNMFNLILLNRLDAEKAKPWLEIFQQPIVYPPPDTHPLYRKP